ncbi:MAG: cbb3-type cytochrome c oxidase subunit I [Candidatus Thiodiazotropha sp. (ex Epidulcina cf. delphinae)]|nr:cbb3-type cytochrome c oxidase subunit I [Candidatus Thiodiazotropha sp. (ex Epidulcina cf. delphinae)]
MNDEAVIGLNAPEGGQRALTLRWLQLGVLALGLAGLFALLLVLSRMPGSERFFPWVDFFRTALVVHVDQSVLIWFLAMSGVVWCLTMTPRPHLLKLQRAAYLFALTGTLGVALSAFVGDGAPLMNNYLPVLQRPVFFLMLGVFTVGIAAQALAGLSTTRRSLGFSGVTHLPSLAAWTVSLAVLMALMALVTAWVQIPAEVNGQGYYEYLFWGPGHTLQFAYTQLLILAWLLLAAHSGVSLPGDSRWYRWLLLIGISPVLLVPLIYLSYETVSLESRTAFTRLMQYGGGLAVTPVGLLILLGLIKSARADEMARPLRRTLWMSMLLFFSGGAIALFITGVNTIIPAHYHGSIVGVTMGLMGLAYLLLPKLGYPPVRGRLADLQPWIYGIGQLLHISGLAVSGAMGIQRKTAGAAQGLETLSAKLAMGVMGIGGLLAVTGGILFVWIMLRALLVRTGAADLG